MAKRSFAAQNYTPAVTADNSILTGAIQGIGAAAAANGLLVSEIAEMGEASASSINGMVFRRSHVLAVGPTALASPNTDGPMNGLTAAAQVGSITYTAVTTTYPTPTNVTTSAKLHLSFNAFGGIFRWVAYPGEEWGIIGVTVDISESTLSCGFGTPGAMSSHIIYEAY